MKIISCLSLLACIMAVATAHDDPPVKPMVTTVQFTCEGDRDICYTYKDQNGNTVSYGGTPKLVLVDGGEQRACGATERSAEYIFIYTPGSTNSGEGFVGVRACLDPAHRTGLIWMGPQTVVYSMFDDWLNAISMH